jgi:hypothetical protein
MNLLILGLDTMQFSRYYTKTVIDIDLFRHQHMKKMYGAYFNGCIEGAEYSKNPDNTEQLQNLSEYCDTATKKHQERVMAELGELGKDSKDD